MDLFYYSILLQVVKGTGVGFFLGKRKNALLKDGESTGKNGGILSITDIIDIFM